MKTITVLCALAIALAIRGNPISLNSHKKTKLMELIETDKDAKARFETLKRAAEKAVGEKPNPIQGCDARRQTARCRIIHPGNS